MRTRASAPPKQAVSEQQPPALRTAEKPSKIFILPKAASSNARFLMLPNPRTELLSRYFFCPELGVFEFTVIAPPPHAQRSVLFTTPSEKETANSKEDTKPGCASITKNAQLLVATPVDIIFFMIPILRAASQSGHTKGLYQPLDDIIDSQDEMAKHLRYVLNDPIFRGSLQSRVEAICDSVEAGDEKMLRFSEEKLMAELISKAERTVAQGLPVSMEDRFIRQALATPLMAVKRDEPVTTVTEAEVQSSEESETRSTTTTASSATTQITSDQSTPTPNPESAPDVPSTPEHITRLLRLSTALSFMKESYIAGDLCTRLDEMLASTQSPIDLKPLTEHLQHVAELRAKALSSRTLTDFTRKRGLEDEEAAESRAEKKRRMEEEEKKKKAGESRAVRDLKKVNTSGMKKMSAFFSKAALAPCDQVQDSREGYTSIRPGQSTGFLRTRSVSKTNCNHRSIWVQGMH
ncbi:hypothetical protein ASPZODRAFT_394443 [Penicilliopsis zonata CBS 506.65]|uniref:Ribonuclease H2 subunit B n=1 Tax=Penicilliopsis zonata CBS 506.65 TaxID=1073090 RepID=A0A1L9SWK7_9EURO|nr:hypothetical protein ASPZODRAFT_394443 [Penicilliopsis zonata CBS 506.65]OJJ51491.1 hypothetical protein ASPZODRAFT_394443 [Penicilliopsis zonata CBS 506.65]